MPLKLYISLRAKDMPKKEVSRKLAILLKNKDNLLLPSHRDTRLPGWVSIFFTRCKKIPMGSFCFN
jgi:hypothetical protein